MVPETLTKLGLYLDTRNQLSEVCRAFYDDKNSAYCRLWQAARFLERGDYINAFVQFSKFSVDELRVQIELLSNLQTCKDALEQELRSELGDLNIDLRAKKNGQM